MLSGNSTFVVRFLPLGLAVGLLSWQRSQVPVPTTPGGEVPDPRILNNVYWKEMARRGLARLNPPIVAPAGTERGSEIEELGQDSPDVPITNAANVTQSENSVFVSPVDSTRVLNSNNSSSWPNTSIFLGTSAFESADSGASWTGFAELPSGDNSGDPATAIDLGGRYYVSGIADDLGQEVNFSDDQGLTWTKRVIAPPPPPVVGFETALDKGHLCVDNSPSSSNVGALYAGWSRFESPTVRPPIQVARSLDRGETWLAPVTISAGVAAGSANQGVNLQTGPNGEVYAIWAVYDSFPPCLNPDGTPNNIGFPCANAAPERAIGFAKSLDGGATWQTARRIINNIRGIRQYDATNPPTHQTNKNQRRNSFPSLAVDNSCGPNRGKLYVVWANLGSPPPGNNSGDDMDVYLISSTNGGTTWSTPTKINQDFAGLGKEHYFPWITCDSTSGDLSVIFYDDRNVVDDHQVEVFVANSSDGGSTWTDFRVSDTAFTPAPVPGLAPGYFGDYIGIAARRGTVYPVWTGNPTGKALSYASPFTLPGATLHVPTVEFPTIQSAVDVACSGAIVQLDALTPYQGAGNRDIDFQGKSLTLRGSGPSTCTIDAQQLGRGLKIVNVTDSAGVIVDGIRIVNGSSTDPNGDWGGGIYCLNSTLQVRNCIIESCRTTIYHGGGIYFSTGFNDDTLHELDIVNCFVRNNSSPSLTDGLAGGIAISTARGIHARIRDCMIYGNTARSAGAGIYLAIQPLGQPQNCTVDIDGCTIAGNLLTGTGTTTTGGGLFSAHLDNSTGLTWVRNSILWGNSANVGAQITIFDGICAVNSSDLEGGIGAIHIDPGGAFGNGLGVINTDPAFQSPPTNYHLKKFSQCINAGSTSFVPLPGETDIDGGPRVLENRIDMGADERFFGAQQGP